MRNAVLFLLGLTPVLYSPLALAGNVLLPNSGASSSSSGLNLSGAAKPSTTPEKTASPDASLLKTTTTSAPQMTPVDNTSLQRAARSSALLNSQTDEFKVRAHNYTETIFEKYAPVEPPQIMPDPVSDDFANVQKGRFKWVIAANNLYTLDLDELSSIKHAIGFDTKQIQSQCRMRFTVSVVTQQDSYSFPLYAGEQRAIPLDYPLQKIMILPNFVCMPPSSLPQYGSVLFRTADNKLVVPLLSSAECVVPNTGMASFIGFQYKGQNRIDCAFK